MCSESVSSDPVVCRSWFKKHRPFRNEEGSQHATSAHERRGVIELSFSVNLGMETLWDRKGREGGGRLSRVAMGKRAKGGLTDRGVAVLSAAAGRWVSWGQGSSQCLWRHYSRQVSWGQGSGQCAWTHYL